MNINLPKKIKVGFQSRNQSLDGNLSFVTYINDKNEIAQQKSWNDWRDENIAPLELDNVPMKGYIFDKSIKRTGGFSSNNSYLRVYDPRGFEFEIKIENVSLIIQNCKIDKGEIKEKCILGWDSRTVYLIPETCDLYKTAILENAEENKNVTDENLVVGNIYKSTRGKFVYVGKEYLLQNNDQLKTKLVNVFYKENHPYQKKEKIILDNFCAPSLSSLKNTQEQAENYDKLIKALKKKSVKRSGLKWFKFDGKTISQKLFVKIKDLDGKDVFCDIGSAYYLYKEGEKSRRGMSNSAFSIYKVSATGFLPEDFYHKSMIAEKNIILLKSLLNKIEEEEKKEESRRDFSFLLKGMIKEEDKLIEL